MSRESDRIDALEAQLAAVLARLPKLSPLEELFPGYWRKTWTGKREGWEEFEVQGTQLRILASKGGVRTTWTVAVTAAEGSVQLDYSHRDAAEFSGFAAVSALVTRQPDGTLTGSEQAADGVLHVTFQPISEVTKRERPRKERGPEFWQQKAAEYRERRGARLAAREAAMAPELAKREAKLAAERECYERADERRRLRLEREAEITAAAARAREDEALAEALAMNADEAVLTKSGPDGDDVAVDPGVAAGLTEHDDPEGAWTKGAD